MAKEADPANQVNEANQADQADQADQAYQANKNLVAEIATTSAIMLLCAVVMASLISGAGSEERKNLNCVTKFYNGKSYEFCGPSTRKAIPPPPNRRGEGRPERPQLHAPSTIPRVGVGEEQRAPSAPPRFREERRTPAAAPTVPPTVSPTVAPTSVPREQSEAPTVGGGPRPVIRDRARTEVPKQGARSSAEPSPALLTVRALIERSELPPRGVAAYGIVAFTSLPIAIDIERYKFVCDAFKATLIPQESLPSGTPLSVQMITFWPINNKHTPDAVRADCSHLIENYDLETGLDAVHDADKQAEGLAERRGPFLIAWSPAESRYQSDSLVLVMDLSRVDGQQNFLEIFQTWRQKIVDNPSLWHGGFVDIETFRRIVRDTLDRYGDGILKLIKAE
jgi:hypothetical protein